MKKRYLFKYIFLILSVCIVFAYKYIQNSSMVVKTDANCPVITFDSNSIQVSVNDKEDNLLKGAKAVDEEDGDLSDQIIIESISNFVSEHTSRVTYLVFDSDGNVGKASRYIEYTDYTAPKFTMSDDMVVSKYSSTELLSRVHAASSVDGNIDSKITVMNASFASNNVIHVKLSVTDSTNTTSYLSLNYYVETHSLKIQLREYLIDVNPESEIDYTKYLRHILSGTKRQDDLMSSVKMEVPEDMSKEGVYEIIYTLESGENDAKAVLVVNVTKDAKVVKDESKGDSNG